MHKQLNSFFFKCRLVFKYPGL